MNELQWRSWHASDTRQSGFGGGCGKKRTGHYKSASIPSQVAPRSGLEPRFSRPIQQQLPSQTPRPLLNLPISAVAKLSLEVATSGLLA